MEQEVAGCFNSAGAGSCVLFVQSDHHFQLIVVAIILISAAAICKALADTLDHHKDTSIFRYMSDKYWNPNVVIKTAPVIFNYPVDVWHIANSMQLLCWVLLAVFNDMKYPWYLQVGGAGLLFIVVFNTFYNRIFR